LAEYRTAELNVRTGCLKALTFVFEYVGPQSAYYCDSVVTMLEDALSEKLAETERKHMTVIQQSVQRMRQLIDDLLSFSRIGGAGMRKAEVNMDKLVQETLSQLQPDLAKRNIDWKIGTLSVVQGDYNLLRQVLLNLISNSVKYTRPRDPAKIEIGSAVQDGEIIIYVRDNGVGFDMNSVDKLFGVFQRLHSESEFEGTGIGLANVRRIIQGHGGRTSPALPSAHGGRTWAEGKAGEGAAFYFSLPSNR